MVETGKPGLLSFEVGRGKVVHLPWDCAGLYYAYGNEGHSGLLKDLIDSLLPQGRQLVTDAHPLIEMVLMRQGERHLLHLINLTGHTDVAYFDPLPVSDIRIRLEGKYREARAAVVGRRLFLKRHRDAVEVLLPHLGQYELIVLR